MKTLISLALFLLLTPLSYAEEFQRIFLIENQNATNEILASNFATKKMVLFRVDEKNELVKKAEKEVQDHLWRAIRFNINGKKHILIAFGYGRGKLDAKLSLKLYDENLEFIEEIFSDPTSRSETSHLQQIGSKVLINYYESKYFTKTGFLKKVGNNWEFVELFKKRLGSHLAVGNKSIAIGRPYGDAQGEDGDVLLYQKGEFTKLPSLRGVRSIAFANIDEDPDLELLIGDGWHQNYGEKAEPRLSQIDKEQDTYKLKNVFLAKNEYAIEKILPFEANNKTFVLASGEKKLWLFDPNNNWQNKELYRIKDNTAFVDYVILKKSKESLLIAILDKEILIKTIEVK